MKSETSLPTVNIFSNIYQFQIFTIQYTTTGRIKVSSSTYHCLILSAPIKIGELAQIVHKCRLKMRRTEEEVKKMKTKKMLMLQRELRLPLQLVLPSIKKILTIGKTSSLNIIRNVMSTKGIWLGLKKSTV